MYVWFVVLSRRPMFRECIIHLSYCLLPCEILLEVLVFSWMLQHTSSSLIILLDTWILSDLLITVIFLLCISGSFLGVGQLMHVDQMAQGKWGMLCCIFYCYVLSPLWFGILFWHVMMYLYEGLPPNYVCLSRVFVLNSSLGCNMSVILYHLTHLSCEKLKFWVIN